MAKGYRHLTYGSRCQIYALKRSGESIRGRRLQSKGKGFSLDRVLQRSPARLC